MKQLQALIPETAEEKANHDLYHNFRTMDGKLTQAGEALVGLAIGLLSEVCFVNSRAHGWYEPYMKHLDPESDSKTLLQRNFGEVMALITSEVSEAFEAYRDGDDQTKIKYGYKEDDGNGNQTVVFTNEPEMHWGDGTLGKPEGIAAELADVLIRVFDYCGAYGVPLGEATIRKHLYNHSRPYRHGGKLA